MSPLGADGWFARSVLEDVLPDLVGGAVPGGGLGAALSGVVAGNGDARRRLARG